MRKLTIILCTSIIALIGGVTYIYQSKYSFTDNLEKYFSVSSSISSVFKGASFNYSDYSDILSVDSSAYLKNYIKDLKDTDKGLLNVTDLYGGSELGKTDIVIGDPSTEEEKKMYKKELDAYLKSYKEYEEYDSRLINKEGVYFIRLKDLDFSEDDTDMIMLGSSAVAVTKDLVKPIYSQMLKSNDFKFVYKTHNSTKLGYNKYNLRIVYASATGNNSLIIHMEIRKGKIEKLRVNKLWE